MRIGEKVKLIKLIKNFQRRKISNDGFSLVELIIVIAILAIAVSIAGISISLAFSRDAEKCAKEIDAALENARMNSLSREGSYTLTIDNDSSELMLVSSVDGTSTSSLQSGINIQFSLSGGTDISAAKGITVEFDKSTGKVKSMMTTEGTSVVGSLLRIRCENSRGKRATVVLVRATGKHYIEYN